MLLAIAFWRNGIVKLMTWAFKLAGKMHIVKDPEKRIVDTTKTIDDAYNEMRYMMKSPRLFARTSRLRSSSCSSSFAISYVIMRGLGCDGDFPYRDFVSGVRVHDFVVRSHPRCHGCCRNELRAFLQHDLPQRVVCRALNVHLAFPHILLSYCDRYVRYARRESWRC